MQNQCVNVAVPVAEDNRPGYVQKWVTNFRLDEEQALELHRIKRGLVQQDARLKSDQPVNSAPQVFQWMLDEIGRARKAAEPVAETPAPAAQADGALPGVEQLSRR